jgi:hypothetical protein
VVIATAIAGPLAANQVFAHCDTMQGPIIPEAKAALEKGDVTPVLKWVNSENEAEITAAFTEAVAVRAKGPEARDLADRYFLETLVRLHRAGEGAPYTGIKDEPVEPIVAMADEALADGSADEMIARINAHLAEAIRDKFNTVLAARESKDEGIEAGREFVEAYVGYTHFVEGIHTAIMVGPDHHREAATKGSTDRSEQPGHEH